VKRVARFPAHGPELRALLAACHADPDDDTPRLVLADWLEEHDDPRGECVRLQVRLAATPADDPEYDTLFEQHQNWWKQHGKLWEKEVGSLMWDAGPHDRGLPTIGYHGGEDDWLPASDLGVPAKDRLSAVIALGWPGMTWAVVEDPLDNDIEMEFTATDRAHAVVACGFDPFEQAPWAGSPTPIGIGFPFGMAVIPDVVNRMAKIPNLRGFSLGDARAAPNVLPRIAKIKSLEHLDLAEMRLNDDGLRTLAPLKNLRSLIASSATITDAGAKVLAKFTELRELRVRSLRLTPAGFQSLTKLSKLEGLKLAKANDATVRQLSGLTRLRTLDLWGTKVTGRGVEQFPLLTTLHLCNTRLDDASFAGIAALRRLRLLNVGHTRITGAAFAHLDGLKNLEWVELSNTKVTTKAENQLRKKLRKATR
jgi:uncharacterized protein (TIGR02996 family)